MARASGRRDAFYAHHPRRERLRSCSETGHRSAASCVAIEVETASLGESGVDLGRLERHDLILLDLNLPEISGFEVLRALRLRSIETPVLILSGLRSEEHTSELQSR